MIKISSKMALPILNSWKFLFVSMNLLWLLTTKIYAGQPRHTQNPSLPALPKTHVTSFARFARQGNFVRIGRPEASRSDDNKLQLSDEYVFKERLPRLIQIMQWYPHNFHRFVRIGRDKTLNDINGKQEGLDSMQSYRYNRPVESIGKLHDQAKKTSGFVRIGRNGMTKLTSPNDERLDALMKQKATDDSKNEYGFDIEDNGKLLDHSQPTNGNQRTQDNKGLAFFRKLSMLPSGTYDGNRRKMRDVYFLDNNFDEKAPSFLKKNKNDYKENHRLADNTPNSWGLKEFEARKIGLDKDISGDSDKNVNFRNLSFGPTTDNLTTKDSKADLLTGKSAKGIDLGFVNPSLEALHPRHRDYAQDEVGTFLSIKRSPELFHTRVSSPNDVAFPDSPIDAANRRSAFVRIGKIPSSAFVRIGKNFDRVFQLPVTKDSFYNQRLRKGRSSFVRIG